MKEVELMLMPTATATEEKEPRVIDKLMDKMSDWEQSRIANINTTSGIHEIEKWLTKMVNENNISLRKSKGEGRSGNESPIIREQLMHQHSCGHLYVDFKGSAEQRERLSAILKEKFHLKGTIKLK